MFKCCPINCHRLSPVSTDLGMRVVNRERLSAINNPREGNREVGNNGFNLKYGKNQFAEERRTETERFKGRSIDLWFQRRWYALFIGILAWIFYHSASALVYCLFCLSAATWWHGFWRRSLLIYFACYAFIFFNISRALHSFRISIIPSANECVVYNNFIVPSQWNLELSSLHKLIFLCAKHWESLLNYGKAHFGWKTTFRRNNFKAPSIFRERFMG